MKSPERTAKARTGTGATNERPGDGPTAFAISGLMPLFRLEGINGLDGEDAEDDGNEEREAPNEKTAKTMPRCHIQS